MTIAFLFVSCSLFIAPRSGECRVAVQVYTVSGTVVTVTPDGAVLLQNGDTFYPGPGREQTGRRIQVGSTVSLRYVLRETKKIYIDLFSGEKQLPQSRALPQKHVPRAAY